MRKLLFRLLGPKVPLIYGALHRKWRWWTPVNWNMHTDPLAVWVRDLTKIPGGSLILADLHLVYLRKFRDTNQ